MREIVPWGSEHEAVVTIKSHQCQSISHLNLAQDTEDRVDDGPIYVYEKTKYRYHSCTQSSKKLELK